MRLFEIEKSFDAEKARNFIYENCEPFLSQISNPVDQVLWRGTFKDINYKVTDVRKDREPTNSTKIEQEFIDSSFDRLGITAKRSNSLFCTGYEYTTQTYGRPFAIFPIGEFSFSWSPNIRDLFTDFHPHMYNFDYDKIRISDLSYDFGLIDKNLTIGDLIRKSQYQNLDAATRRFEHHHLNRLVRRDPEVMLAAANLDKFDDYIRQSYMTTDLPAAIESHNEILIHCEKYFAVSKANLNLVFTE